MLLRLSVIFQTFLLFPTLPIYSFFIFYALPFLTEIWKIQFPLKVFCFFIVFKEKNIIFINSELHPKSIYFIN